MNTRPLRPAIALIAAGILALGAPGCAATSPASIETPAETSTAVEATAVRVADAWVKTADSGMTAAFATITNDGASDVNVVGVDTPAAAMSELHETVEDETGTMVMRPIEGGFILPAGDDFVLEPAGNHLMMMELTAALHAGDEVPFTLVFADGSSLDFTAVVKDYSGANENYVGDDMNMGGDQ